MIKLTDSEKKIIDLIKENPLVSQEEIAEKIGCARASVAVHISNLMKKGVILGKRYVVNEAPYILTIGATNVDIQGKSSNKILRYDSSPGEVTFSFGGVGKNIAENISRLGIESKFITALGDDIYGKDIETYLKAQNVDLSDSLFLKDEQTSMYVAILNDGKEMEMAVSSTDICRHITPLHLEKSLKTIMEAKILVVDTNLEQNSLRYLTELKNRPEIILDTVSTTKAAKVKDFIGKFHTVKPNRIEAEILSDITIYDDKDLLKIGDFFLNKGVKKVFVSLGSQGTFYMDGEQNGIIKTPRLVPVSTAGAGDAFVAGIAYSQYNDFDIERSAKFGIAASVLTSLSNGTVNEHMTAKNVETIIKEMNI